MEFSTDFEKQLISNASRLGKTIILPEAGYSKISVEAGIEAAKLGVAKIIFLVHSDDDLNKFQFSPQPNISVINITTSELLPILASALYQKRSSKGVTMEEASKLVLNEIYFATMMVELNFADGLVAGAENTTANTIRPALQIIKGKTPSSIISSFFIMAHPNKSFGENGILMLSDCAINLNPSAEEIVQITYDTVTSAKVLTSITPKVALLSYSTLGSAQGDDAVKMRSAASQINAENPPFVVDGEMQLDASIVPHVAAKKAPNSKLKGDANIFIFPNLSSGNIGYKLMQRYGGFTAIGPICQGFNKPVNDVSRGANVNEICLTIAITCLQAN